MTVTLWDPALAGEVVTVKFSNISVFGTPGTSFGISRATQRQACAATK